MFYLSLYPTSVSAYNKSSKNVAVYYKLTTEDFYSAKHCAMRYIPHSICHFIDGETKVPGA